MARLNKQNAHLSDLQNAKRQQLLAQQGLDFSKNNLHAVHWEGFSKNGKGNIKFSDVNNDFLMTLIILSKNL
jgi:hypothetical protein